MTAITRKPIIGLCRGDIATPPGCNATVSRFLRDAHGFSVASPMQAVMQAARRLAGWDDSMDERGLATLDRMCRSGRACDEDYWLNLAMRGIPKDDERILLDDLFFRNEYMFVVRGGGVVIRLSEGRGIMASDDELKGVPHVDIEWIGDERDLLGKVAQVVDMVV